MQRTVEVTITIREIGQVSTALSKSTYRVTGRTGHDLTTHDVMQMQHPNLPLSAQVLPACDRRVA